MELPRLPDVQNTPCAEETFEKSLGYQEEQGTSTADSCTVIVTMDEHSDPLLPACHNADRLLDTFFMFCGIVNHGMVGTRFIQFRQLSACGILV